MNWVFGVLLSSIAATAFAATAFAAPTNCREDYAKGQAPDIISNPGGKVVKELCYRGFAVEYSYVSNTPMWSAEHLTRQRIDAAHHVRRANDFHPENRLPEAHRATLMDYYRSGFDRGHMSPSGDMATKASDRDSFSLANMIPQNPDNNRNLWEGIEASTRYMALHYGSIYVISGPIFEGQPRRLHGLVEVPTRLFKAVYVPSLNAGAAYVTRNAAGRKYQVVSLSKLRSITGLRLFPGVTPREEPLSLDKPYIYRDHHHRHKRR